MKYWLSLSDEEQERRFEARIHNPGKRWKLSPMDLEARAHWVDYAEAKDEMFAFTDIKEAPWNVVDADNKQRSAAQPHQPSPRAGSVPGRAARGVRAAAAPGTRVPAAADRQPDVGAEALRRGVTRGHDRTCATWRSNGSRHASGAISWWIAFGPHEPGGYGRTGGGFSSSGFDALPQAARCPPRS